MNEALLEGMEMFPNFVTPPNTLNHRQVGGVLSQPLVSTQPRLPIAALA